MKIGQGMAWNELDGVCKRTTCEYFRVASNVVTKAEKEKGGQEVEEIVPRLKVFPEDSSSHLCLTASVHC